MYTYMGEVFREIRQGRNISLKKCDWRCFFLLYVKSL